jgi:hypothetical protein
MDFIRKFLKLYPKKPAKLALKKFAEDFPDEDDYWLGKAPMTQDEYSKQLEKESSTGEFFIPIHYRNKDGVFHVTYLVKNDTCKIYKPFSNR